MNNVITDINQYSIPALDSRAQGISAISGDAGEPLHAVPVAEALMDDGVSLVWVQEQNERTDQHLRHNLALAILQEEEWAAERAHFYNEVLKRGRFDLEDDEDVEKFISALMNSQISASMLRDTAPGALDAARTYVRGMETDQALYDAGYRLSDITNDFKEHVGLSQAYAQKLGGDEGLRRFKEALAGQQENYTKGMGNSRVGLALSGTMLGMSLIMGAGPIGATIAGLRFANSLLKTQAGQLFQAKFHAGVIGFLDGIGVDPAVSRSMTESVANIYTKTMNNRWGKAALMGLQAVSALSTGHIDIGALTVEGAINTAQELSGTAYAGAKEQVGSLAAQFKEGLNQEVAAVDEGAAGQADSHATSEASTVESGQVLESSPSPAAGGVCALYDIQSGDTLWAIAKTAYKRMNEGGEPNTIQIINMVNHITELNGIDNPNLIYEGKSLVLPMEPQPDAVQIHGNIAWLDEKGASQLSKEQSQSPGVTDPGAIEKEAGQEPEKRDLRQRLGEWREQQAGSNQYQAETPIADVKARWGFRQ